VSYWLPPSTMDAVLAPIVNGGRAILLKTQRLIGKNYFSFFFRSYYSMFFGCGLSCADTSNPCCLKGKRLRHHGRGIYCTFCGSWWMVSWCHALFLCRKVPENNLTMRLMMSQSGPPRLAPHPWSMDHAGIFDDRCRALRRGSGGGVLLLIQLI
jgi:hypothetical protein